MRAECGPAHIRKVVIPQGLNCCIIKMMTDICVGKSTMPSRSQFAIHKSKPPLIGSIIWSQLKPSVTQQTHLPNEQPFYPELKWNNRTGAIQRHTLKMFPWPQRSWTFFEGLIELVINRVSGLQGPFFFSGTGDESQLLRKCSIINCSVLQWNSRHANLWCKQQNNRLCLLWSNRTGQQCNIEDLKCAYREVEKPRAGEGWISISSKKWEKI